MGGKYISLDEIAKKKQITSYLELVNFIREKIDEGEIKPVKAHGTNGKSPTLYNDYHLIGKNTDYSKYIDEIRYRLSPKIDISYYLAHPNQYVAERREVLDLSSYLDGKSEKLSNPVSLNERSFEIWGREKFLSSRDKGNKRAVTGNMVLKHTGVTLKMLNIYETSEPLAYYCHSRVVPQNILILENKDTFYTMRRHLIGGGKTVFGMEVETLVYGAGKGIIRAFRDRNLCVEPYVQDIRNEIYYFGDLDFEGIRIFEQLHEKFQSELIINPFVKAYEVMVEKGINDFGPDRLPKMKDGQVKELSGVFMSYFPDEMQRKMCGILDGGKYIPQEIVNITML